MNLTPASFSASTSIHAYVVFGGRFRTPTQSAKIFSGLISFASAASTGTTHIPGTDCHLEHISSGVSLPAVTMRPACFSPSMEVRPENEAMFDSPFSQFEYPYGKWMLGTDIYSTAKRKTNEQGIRWLQEFCRLADEGVQSLKNAPVEVRERIPIATLNLAGPDPWAWKRMWIQSLFDIGWMRVPGLSLISATWEAPSAKTRFVISSEPGIPCDEAAFVGSAPICFFSILRDVFSSSAYLIDWLLSISVKHRSPASPNDQRPDVKLDPPCIFLDGTPWPLDVDAAVWLKWRIECNERVSDTKLKNAHPDTYLNARPDRWRKRLPDAVNIHVDTNSDDSRWLCHDHVRITLQRQTKCARDWAFFSRSV